jgi:LmbE family N-acetylglucosaminyl deacetylase
MQFHLNSAEIFVPDGMPETPALARTTHMAIGAHPDDLEVMAVDGILACFQRPDRWFTGVVVTNGSGSARDNVYRDYSDADMQFVRRKEQKKAAVVGEYSAQVFLDYSSAAVKDSANPGPRADLAAILQATRPEVVYTHNLADRHDTHVAVALAAIDALRSLPASARPRHLYGCEAWRDLDWLVDMDKVAFDVSDHENMQAALIGIFDSQIAGGKRYDLATMGRRRAHATYLSSHSVDTSTGMILAMDLTPLIENPDLDVGEYIGAYITRFAEEVEERLRRLR